jgi:CRISPR-associated protein Cmr1
MEEVTLELETVTPLFIAGADQRNIENEGLRAPSLRGLLRWWFRALTGNYLNNDFKNLKKIENEIFGSPEFKSRVSLRVHFKCSPEIIEREYRSWREAIVWSDYVDSLFFSCLDKRKDRRTNRIRVKSRPFYPEKSEFKVTICGKENELKACVASLWALVYLGGVGFRARRGGGCLKVKNVIGDTFGLEFICKTLNNLEDFLKNNLNKAISIVEDYLKSRNYILNTPTSIPNYSLLSSQTSALFIKKIKRGDWKLALNDVGKWYIGQKRGVRFTGGFRMKLADYDFSHKIKRATREEKIKGNEKRQYLGLPITYANYKATLTEESFNRRASPLFFGVYKIDDTFIPRIAIFNSVFLPKSPNFEIRKKIRVSRHQEREITLETDLPENGISKTCFNDLLNSGWRLVWGGIR